MWVHIYTLTSTGSFLIYLNIFQLYCCICAYCVLSSIPVFVSPHYLFFPNFLNHLLNHIEAWFINVTHIRIFNAISRNELLVSAKFPTLAHKRLWVSIRSPISEWNILCSWEVIKVNFCNIFWIYLSSRNTLDLQQIQCYCMLLFVCILFNSSGTSFIFDHTVNFRYLLGCITSNLLSPFPFAKCLGFISI